MRFSNRVTAITLTTGHGAMPLGNYPAAVFAQSMDCRMIHRSLSVWCTFAVEDKQRIIHTKTALDRALTSTRRNPD